MAQVYSDPDRENDPYSLPNVEVFYVSSGQAQEHRRDAMRDQSDDSLTSPGWYYWYCFPGCLPDSEAIGPYESEQAAINAAREE